MYTDILNMIPIYLFSLFSKLVVKVKKKGKRVEKRNIFLCGTICTGKSTAIRKLDFLGFKVKKCPDDIFTRHVPPAFKLEYFDENLYNLLTFAMDDYDVCEWSALHVSLKQYTDYVCHILNTLVTFDRHLHLDINITSVVKGVLDELPTELIDKLKRLKVLLCISNNTKDTILLAQTKYSHIKNIHDYVVIQNLVYERLAHLCNWDIISLNHQDQSHQIVCKVLKM